jgi:hypothetical protein
MTKRFGISKWQKKSTQVNKIRWELRDVLNDEFTDEEKESSAYDELVESVRIAYLYCVPKLKEEKKSPWKTMLVISLASSGGAILLKVVECLLSWLSAHPAGSTP